MHKDPSSAGSGSDISTYGKLGTLFNFIRLVTVGDSTTPFKGKSEINLWNLVQSGARKRPKSAFGGGRLSFTVAS